MSTHMPDTSLVHASPEPQASADVWPIGKKSAYFSCFIAFMLGLFDLIDRQILGALFPFMKAEYALTDAQLGSLMSVLNIAIAVLVVPCGYLIDRWSRKYMLVLMGTVWSLATLACAFAGSYTHLLIARFVCGAGEAGYNPAAQSLLSASFPRRLRTTAAGMAQFGMLLGAPVGLVVGAYVATHYGWRHALGLVAIPGLIISLLAFFLKDFKTPPRASVGEKVQQATYAQVLVRMMRTPSLLCVYFAAASILLFNFLLMAWLPSYFNRVANMPITQASSIAALTLISASMGLMLFAPVVDFFRKYKSNAGAIWLSGCMALCICCSVYVFYFAIPGSTLQIIALILVNLLLGAVPSVGSGMILDLTPPAERGTAISLMVLIQNIFGMAVGPALGGYLSDRYGIQMGLLVCSFAMAIGMVLHFICSFTFQRDLDKVAQSDATFN